MKKERFGHMCAAMLGTRAEVPRLKTHLGEARVEPRASNLGLIGLPQELDPEEAMKGSYSLCFLESACLPLLLVARSLATLSSPLAWLAGRFTLAGCLMTAASGFLFMLAGCLMTAAAGFLFTSLLFAPFVFAEDTRVGLTRNFAAGVFVHLLLVRPLPLC